jgi:hypothetical protein
MLTALNDQISVLDQEIAPLFAAHPDRRCMRGIGARPRNLVTAGCHVLRLAVDGGGCIV